MSFPASLFSEVVFTLGRGHTPGAWYPNAIYYSAATMPLVAVPAVVALRWSRLGGALFILAGLFDIYQRLYQPFGVIFPEATQSGFIGVPVLDMLIQPGFIVAALLFIGSMRGPVERQPRTSPLMVAPR